MNEEEAIDLLYYLLSQDELIDFDNLDQGRNGKAKILMNQVLKTFNLHINIKKEKKA